ncbi:phosphotransferase family protein [Streptomyces sp. NPDC059679]|uniref:phosphotransferase family protein n=1 Tax=Streptomyces sp. NPDC059679 TaxID=3346903 RepID=UPI00368728B3
MSGTVREDVVPQLVDVVRHRSAPHHGPVGEPIVLADRRDATVIRHGSVVAKAHAPDTDPDELAVRVRVAGHPRCAGILLPPLGGPGALPGGRAVTLWPYGEPVSPDHPEAAPWAEAGGLLARLHSVEPAALPGPLPPMRGPAKAARAIARLRRAGAGVAGPAAEAVLRAWGALPGWARGEGAAAQGGGALCHGDLHLGQLVRCAGSPEHPGLPEHPNPSGTPARWLLIDVDDLGLGDPAWDLARPAAWFAAGLLAPDDWVRFLGAYRAAGGPAVRECQEDPWARLDVPARALTVQLSALALAKAAREGRPLDEAEESMVEACLRIARLAGA